METNSEKSGNLHKATQPACKEAKIRHSRPKSPKRQVRLASLRAPEPQKGSGDCAQPDYRSTQERGPRQLWGWVQGQGLLAPPQSQLRDLEEITPPPL